MNALIRIGDLADKLSELAGQTRKLQEQIFRPIDVAKEHHAMSLEEAAYTLRAAFGIEGFFSIKCEVDFHRDGEVKVEWRVYLLKEQAHGSNYHATTLEGAVNACLACNQPPPANPVEAVQAILQPDPPLPF